MHRSALQRVRDRITELLEARGKTQRDLAKAIDLGASALNTAINGKAATRGLLYRLDDIAKSLGVTPSDLVKREDAPLYELTRREALLIKHWRHWPPSVRERVWGLLIYFSAALPEEVQPQREWWWKIRQLDPTHQQALKAEAERLLREQIRKKSRNR